MVGAETDETHYGEPDGYYFGDYFAGGEGEEDGHADEPIAWVLLVVGGVMECGECRGGENILLKIHRVRCGISLESIERT